MNPSPEWKHPTAEMFENFNKSTDRFFYCDCRFGQFKLRSALENMFLIRCHYEDSVYELLYESLRIPYTDVEGMKRVIIPDFLLNKKHIIEIKAKNMHSNKNVKQKMYGVLDYIINKNMSFRLLSFEDFDNFFDIDFNSKRT